MPVYGGAPMDQQIRSLRRGADIVVATPGRALDHLRRQTLVIEGLEILVLDEADEMLDMGFAEDLETILTATPATRQTALFAATMAPRIASIAERHLKSPARVVIKAEKRPAGKLPQVRQVAYVVPRAQKGPALGRVLEFEDPASAIVFCRTRVEVDELTDILKSHGYGAQALHGGMEQKQRDRVTQLFRQEKADILVATDVAARGLDIDHVSHVINYDIPTAPEVYVHRIGRTGRIGREGVAITLVDPREQRRFAQIERITGQPIEMAPLPTTALQAKRLGQMRSAIEERIKAGGSTRNAFIASLAHDADVMDVAAAVVSLPRTGEKRTMRRTRRRRRPRRNAATPGVTAANVAVESWTAGIMAVGNEAAVSAASAGREGVMPHGRAIGTEIPRRTGRLDRCRCCSSAPGGPPVSAPAISSARSPMRRGSTRGSWARSRSRHITRWSMPEALVDRVIRALSKTKLRGQTVEARRHRPER